MQTEISKKIKYFHDCYRADNREQLIFDFLDKKTENRLVMEGKEELVNGELPIVPIDPEYAEELVKKISLFEKEKELLYACFFVCGKYLDSRGVKKSLCAPLFYYPAEIEQKDEFYYLSLKLEERQLNLPLLNLLSKDSADQILQDPLFTELSSDTINFGDIGKIVSLAEKYFPELSVKNIYNFPENQTQKTIKSTITKAGKKEETTYVLQTSSILGLVEKSTNSRGVLNELSELGALDDYSEPLKVLLDENKPANASATYNFRNLPVILSDSQKAVLKSAATKPHTVIVGPPGTGKTYTISAVAIQHLSRSESVLIVSRTDEAVDVIDNKIKEIAGFDYCTLRLGSKRTYKSRFNKWHRSMNGAKLKSFLQSGLKQSPIKDTKELYSVFKATSDKQQACVKLISSIEKEFEKEMLNELNWGEHLSKENKNLFDNLKTAYLNIKNKLQKPIWEYSKALQTEDSKQVEYIKDLLQMRFVIGFIGMVADNWKDFQTFGSIINMGSDTQRAQKLQTVDMKKIVSTYPVWLCNLSEIKDFVPFKKEIFDLVIIDEATQCDIASCLPAIQRAKRVVFTGDPNQLRHVSFLSKGMQLILQDKNNIKSNNYEKLDYRNKSILDFSIDNLSSGEQISMLDEHFRSIEPIIQFSNENFYNNELRIMTIRPDEKEQGVYFEQCKGTRIKNGSNQAEAEKIISNIRQQIDLEKKLNSQLCTKIGVLSPFRGQVDLLSRLILQNFSANEIKKHAVKVGTAYSFQGEERDCMHISFAVDKTSHHSAFIHINKEDVFNVSITRARNRQYIYISFDKDDIKPGSLLHRFVTSTKTNHHRTDQAEHDAFLHQVTETLKENGINEYWIGFPVAGLSIDILVKKDEHYYGIDLIGYPGQFTGGFGIERYRILNRAGICILPLPYSDWYFEFDKTKQALIDFISAS